MTQLVFNFYDLGAKTFTFAGFAGIIEFKRRGKQKSSLLQGYGKKIGDKSWV